MPKDDIFNGKQPSCQTSFIIADHFLSEGSKFEPANFNPEDADWGTLGYLALTSHVEVNRKKIDPFYKNYLPEFAKEDRNYARFAQKALTYALCYETDRDVKKQLHYLLGEAARVRYNSSLKSGEYEIAIKHFEAAEEYGQYMRAIFMLEGIGYMYDPKRAAELLKNNKNLYKDKNVLCALGHILTTGNYLNVGLSTYIEINFDEGIAMLKKAIDLINPIAAFFLAQLYTGHLLYPEYYGEPVRYLNTEADSKQQAEYYFNKAQEIIPLSNYCLYVLDPQKYAHLKDAAIAALKTEEKRDGYFADKAKYFLAEVEKASKEAKKAPAPVIQAEEESEHQSEGDAAEFMPPDMGENAVLLTDIKTTPRFAKPKLTIEITDERLDRPLESPDSSSSPRTRQPE